MKTRTVTIRPQPGPQEKALACSAKVVLLGGAKGGGKSYALRLAPARYLHLSGFHAAIFRRSLPQHKKPGGMWDKTKEIYPHLGGVDRKSELKWLFPAGSSIMLSHLLDESDWLDWQGTETAMFCFDQLEEFSQTQFLKILGCMRSVSGAPTQIVCSMNPDAESWVRLLVDPWIASDGYIDPEKNGQTFYFTVEDGHLLWVDKDWRDVNGQPPISIAYFSADVWDNPALLAEDPSYLSNLMSQGLVDRERFLGQKGRGGNWNVKAVAGKVWRSEWLPVLPSLPPTVQLHQCRLVRWWDFASSEAKLKGDDPDWTAGTKMLLTPDKMAYVLDVKRDRLTPAGVDRLVAATASQDGGGVTVGWFQDPAQAGVHQGHTLRSLLRGYDACGYNCQLGKLPRFKPFSRACEFNEVRLIEGDWNDEFINELVSIPDGDHDDQGDSASGAYNYLSGLYQLSFRKGSLRTS